MNGEWIILVWVLVSVIFLVKIPTIREFFAKVRKMSAIGIICMMLSLGFLANMSYTKEGVTTNQSTSQTVSLSAENLSSLTQSSISARTGLPDFWKDDPTDTDGDGIPDLWEKWTHGNKLVDDSDLDRDGDGLTDLEEFLNQTDPRTADTDGDSFSDAFEVAHGMNPVSAEDFIPVEPDANNNGVPDIWEQIGYSGSFHDANENGFDDTYERSNLPPVSDDNFDVLVDVYTTRSATLNWTIGENRGTLLMLPTTGTSVKIRLPFGSDTELDLLSSPYGTDPQSGELWKARMGLSFVPRAGQATAGTCIISEGGGISQQVVGQATVITRFPDAPASMQMRSLSSGDGDCPRILILQKRFEIVPDSKLFHVGDATVGPFSITNAVNIDSANITWRTSHGSMSPLTGDSSFLVVGSIPDGDKPIIITAEIELDDMFVAEKKAEVRLCHSHGFSLDSYTVNFSPHLGETHVTSMTLPGCVHHNEPGWLEIEIMRETTAGWQHVAWIDMDPSTSGVDQYGDAVLLPHHPTFIWDGIATEGAAAAESPDEFTAGTTSFHRALPQVVAGEPVPPPYYTTFVRLWNSEKDVILNEERRETYVPQVVKIEMTDEACFEFTKPIVYPDTYWPNLLTSAVTNCVFYLGTNGTTKTRVLGDVLTKSQRRIPSTVNLIFTTNAVLGRYKTMSIKTIGNYKETWKRGQLSGSVSWCNSSPTGGADIYADSIAYWTAESLILHLSGVSHDESLCLGNHLPFTYDGLCESFAGTVVHETGHTLGLVNKTFMYGSSGSHNSKPKDVWIMNSGGVVDDVYRFGVFGKFPTWKPRNLLYLQFILPIPVGQ